jgi:hypothetical protein
MSNKLQVFRVEGKPKAIVLLFGWLGAQLRHVNKYAQIYTQKGCSVVTGVADSVSTMRNDTNTLNEFALEAATEAAKLMRSSGNTDTPVIVHVFSNGGAFVLERLECLMQSAIPGSDVAIVGNGIRLGGQVFDSAPGYLHLRAGLKAVGTAAPNFLIRWIIQLYFLLYIVCGVLLSLVLGRSTRPIQFWNHMKDSTVARRQVYIYSTADELTDPVTLRELIEYRCKKGIEVQSLEFTETHHVEHFRSHPKEYVEAIDVLLASIDKDD